MSTADTSSSISSDELSAPVFMPVARQERLLTAADLAALPSELPSGPVHYELDNGRLVIMSPPGRRHGSSQSRIAAQFFIYGEEKGHGEVMTDVGVVLWRNPDRVVSPDVAFVTKSQLPTTDSPEGYIETIPALIVEVKSKNNSTAEIEQKTKDYLRAGVRIVWIVDNDAGTVTVYRAEGEPQVLRENDLLRADDVIPEMELPVAKLFSARP
jgi:Uma2 family endonuclease